MTKPGTVAIVRPSVGDSIRQVTRLLQAMAKLTPDQLPPDVSDLLPDLAEDIRATLSEDEEETKDFYLSAEVKEFIDSLYDLVRFAPHEEDVEVIASHLKTITAPNIFLDFDTVEGCRMWRRNTGVAPQEFAETLGYSVDMLDKFEAGELDNETARPIHAAYRLHAMMCGEQHLTKHLANSYSEQIKRDDPQLFEYLTILEVVKPEETN